MQLYNTHSITKENTQYHSLMQKCKILSLEKNVKYIVAAAVVTTPTAAAAAASSRSSDSSSSSSQQPQKQL